MNPSPPPDANAATRFISPSEQVPSGSVPSSSTTAANGARTTTMDDGCSSGTLDNTPVDFEPSDDNQDLSAAVKEEAAEEEDKPRAPALPLIPAIYASFVSPAAWAAMSAATRSLLVNGIPTLVESIHREEEMALANRRAQVDEKPRVAVSPATTTAVPITEPEAPSTVLHCDGIISSRQAAADREALISSTARFAAEQRRVASLQAGRQNSSRRHITPHAHAAKGFQGPQEPTLAPAPSRNGAYVYKKKKNDISFLGILLTVIASHHQHSFMKHDAAAVMRAAGILTRELKDFPGATLAHVLGHAAAPSSTSSLTTLAHELLLVLRAAYGNACRPITWPQLPRSIPPVAAVDAQNCAIPAVAKRNATGVGKKPDNRNHARSSLIAHACHPTTWSQPPQSIPPVDVADAQNCAVPAVAHRNATISGKKPDNRVHVHAHGNSRRGRRQGNVRDPVSKGASKFGLAGRRLGKEKGNGNGNGRGKGKNLHRPAVPHPPPAASFVTPAPALLPPSGGAGSSSHLGW